MDNTSWTREMVWIARDANGRIIRAQDDSPQDLLEIADGLREFIKRQLQVEQQ